MFFDQLTSERGDYSIAPIVDPTLPLAVDYQNSIWFDLRHFKKPSARVDALYDHFIAELNDVRHDRVFQKNLRCLVYNLNRLQTHRPGGVLVCPKQHKYWSDLGRGINPFEISMIVSDLAWKLKDMGYVGVKPGSFFTDGSAYTRIWPTDKFNALLDDSGLEEEPLVFDKNDELVLYRIKKPKVKGQKRTPKDEPKIPATGRKAESMRAVLRDYNTLLQRANIQIDVPANNGRKMGLDDVVYRVFNNPELTLGGRFYGGFWSFERKELRPHIIINGHATVELDFKAQHPYMVYGHYTGVHYDEVYGDGDPYILHAEDGTAYSREVCKPLLLTALNAKSELQTCQAIREDLRKDKKSALKKFRRGEAGWEAVEEIQRQQAFFNKKSQNFDPLLKACHKKHSRIKDYLCTGRATKLQFLDSQVAEYIIRTLTEEGIVVLCVHDSFIVEYNYETRLREVMTQAYTELGMNKSTPPIKRK